MNIISIGAVLLLVAWVNLTVPVGGKKYRPEISEYCFGEIGCITTTCEWFDKKLRPLNPKPDNRHTIKTRFWLYMRGNVDKNGLPKGELLPANPSFLNCTKFNPNLETKILIHDFTSSGEAGWMKHFMKSLFAKAEWNVIVVDWESGAGPPLYKAAANCRLVALEIIFLLDILLDKSHLILEDVHIIGQGLGAHTAGYVGEELAGLGRITGLDPTSTLFSGLPPVVRLDETDASFVDVIHSDGQNKRNRRGQGILTAIGHIDFYPNGGKQQPGCRPNRRYPPLGKLRRNSLAVGQVYPGCSHKRASKYLIETASNVECPFVGFSCPNYTSLVNAKCFQPLTSVIQCMRPIPRHVMGLMSDAYGKPAMPYNKYYLKTADESQFCIYPYLVTIGLHRIRGAKHHVQGRIHIRLHEKEDHIDLNLTPNGERRFMEHGDYHNFFVYHPRRLGALDHLELNWEYRVDGKHVTSLCVLCHSSLFVHNVTVASLGYYPPKNHTSYMCSEKGEYLEVKHKQTQLFIRCDSKKKLKHFG